MLVFRKYIKKLISSVLQSLFLGVSETIKLSTFKGPVLVIAPHPDDETLGCGGVIASLRQREIPVRLVLVSDGSASAKMAKIAPEELARQRRSEAQKAAQKLGVPETEIVFLSYPDENVREHQKKVLKDLAAQTWLFTPQIILAPYYQDQNEDHRVIGDCVRALRRAKKITASVYYYPMWFWPRIALQHLCHPLLFLRYKKIDVREALTVKREAFACYKTQVEGVDGLGKLDQDLIGQHMGNFEYFIEEGKSP